MRPPSMRRSAVAGPAGVSRVPPRMIRAMAVTSQKAGGVIAARISSSPSPLLRIWWGIDEWK